MSSASVGAKNVQKLLKSGEPGTKNIWSTKQLMINKRDLSNQILANSNPPQDYRWNIVLKFFILIQFKAFFWPNIQKCYCTVTKSLTSLSSSVIMMQVRKMRIDCRLCSSNVKLNVHNAMCNVHNVQLNVQLGKRARALAPYLAIVHELPINTRHPSNPLLRSARLWLTLQYVLRQKLPFQTSMMSLDWIDKEN